MHLLVIGPDTGTQRVPVPEGTLRIGRAEDNDVVLPSQRVSRHHAELVSNAGEVRIRDLGSRNGTSLNGRSVGSVSRTLRPGDVVLLGPYTLRAEADEIAEGVIPDGFVTLLCRNEAGRPSSLPAPAEEPGRSSVAALLSLAELAVETPSLDALVSKALDCAREITGFEDGVVLIRGEGGVLEVAARSRHDVVWSRTIVGAAVARGSTLLVRNLSINPHHHSQSLALSGAEHVLCAPLCRGGDLHGALYVATRSGHLPPPDAVDMTSAIGRILVAALERRHPTQSRLEPRLACLARFVKDALDEVRRACGEDDLEQADVRVLLDEAAAAATQLADGGALPSEATYDAP